MSEEAGRAGKNAAKFVLDGGENESGRVISLHAESGARYTVPTTIDPERMDENLIVRFRVGAVYKDSFVSVYFGDERVQHRKKQIIAPGEMEQVVIKRNDLLNKADIRDITIKIETE